jgi:hypothetical protein
LESENFVKGKGKRMVSWGRKIIKKIKQNKVLYAAM